MPRRTWTDDDLRQAIAAATTWADVLRALGVSRGGSSRARLRRRAGELGIDTSHIVRGTGGGARRSWTDDDLARAVVGATTLHQVFIELGLKVGGGSWVAMKEHIARLQLDTSHWDRDAVRPGTAGQRVPVSEWTDAQLRAAARDARSTAEVMRRLGLDPLSQRGRRQLVRRLGEVGVDVTAFAGQAWAAGRTRPGGHGRPLEEILRRGMHLSTSRLRQRLIAEGVLPARCASCELDRWLTGPIPLQLDHIDGDRTNNLLENLRLLCPNCHALTDTYCGRNIGRR